MADDDDVLLTTDQLSKLRNVPPNRIEKERLKGEGPPFIRDGRLVRYRLGDYRTWVAGQRRFQSTSEKEAALTLMAPSARRRGLETRAPRKTLAGVERGTTNYVTFSNTADSATSLRLQRLFGLGIIGDRADLIASLAWGAAR